MTDDIHNPLNDHRFDSEGNLTPERSRQYDRVAAILTEAAASLSPEDDAEIMQRLINAYPSDDLRQLLRLMVRLMPMAAMSPTMQVLMRCAEILASDWKGDDRWVEQPFQEEGEG